MFCFKFYEIVISTLHYPCNPCVAFLVLQTCKLEDVDAVIEQFHDIFCTTLRECLRILGENVVILFIFLKTACGEASGHACHAGHE